jgi:hypothetical protein
MYIGADNGDMKTVGFAADDKAIPKGAVVAGFGLFGGWAFNNNVKDGVIEMKFVASPTTEEDVYRWVVLLLPYRTPS